MATVTPNFNWPVPTSTDLVKDGATAMEALGDAIDTSMVDLKGGTTGQVLAKASNTDMDFSWVAQDDSNAIQNTIVDAKGDLIAASAADTPARLAVGNNGETLVADSSTSTGLRYNANYAAGKNKYINGDFSVWQRGTSFTIVSTDTYTADRWLVSSGAGGTCTVTQQTFTPGAAPVAGYEGSTYLQAAYSVSGTGAYFYQKIEDVRTFAGQTVTVSFWGRITSGTKANCLIDIVQNFGSGGSTAVASASTDPNFTLTTTWTRFTQVVPIASISGKTIGTSSFLYPRIQYGTSGTSTYQFWGVQIEAGSVATAFQTATGTIQGELAACQRYFYDPLAGVTDTDRAIAPAFMDSTTAFFSSLALPVQMRVSPSFSVTAGSFNLGYPSNTALSTLVITGASNKSMAAFSGTTANALTANKTYYLFRPGSTATFQLSAEL